MRCELDRHAPSRRGIAGNIRKQWRNEDPILHVLVQRALQCNQTIVLRLRRSRDAYRAEVMKLFKDPLDFPGVAVPDDKRRTQQDIAKRLVRVVCTRNTASK